MSNQAIQDWIRALSSVKQMEGARTTCLALMLDDLADAHGDATALVSDTERLTYRDLAGRVNQYARWAIAMDLGKDSVVALLMPNRAEYVAVWMGLNRAGCTAALINTNLRGDALLDGFLAARAQYLIVDDHFTDTVVEIANRLPHGSRVWRHSDVAIAASEFGPTTLEISERAAPAWSDRALLLGTSGTTGPPKAVNITHARIAEWGLWFGGMMNVQATDRLFNCLPMYHSTGGIVAIGAMLSRGGAVVIRERFSATRFWDDVCETKCTIFMYIGELCRYLTLAPRHPKEAQHSLRLACGNGLQQRVWEEFRQRFSIPRILEFYAATEGVVSLYNCEGRPGAVGRIPSFLAHRFTVRLIRNDPSSGQPVRDSAGACVACGTDEVGELITKVSDAGSRFDGYTDASASDQKIITDVFHPGDRWFRSGDLMHRDMAGYFYFIDRIGDTFRWRGENVSTTQVATTLRACPGVIDGVVFGVVVPRYEGRAGMAAVVVDEGFSLDVMWAFLASHLPPYAFPIFIRRCHSLEITGTMKLVKGRLATEGYANSPDPVWFYDRAARRFVSCDTDALRAIEEGRYRL